jgi:hypothetical protein
MREIKSNDFADDFPSPQPLCVVIGGVYENCWGCGGCGQRGEHLSPILRSSDLSSMDRLYRTCKRWGMGKEDAGAQRPYQKKRPG